MGLTLSARWVLFIKRAFHLLTPFLKPAPCFRFLTGLRLFLEKVIVAYRPTLGHEQLQFQPL